MTVPGIPVVMSCVDVCLIWTTWLIVDRQLREDGARGDARVSRAQIEGEHAGGAAEARAPNRPYGRLSATSAVTTSPAAAAAATQPRRLRPCPNHSQAAPAAAPAPRWPWRCCGRHGRSAPGGEPAGAAGRAGGGAGCGAGALDPVTCALLAAELGVCSPSRAREQAPEGQPFAAAAAACCAAIGCAFAPQLPWPSLLW